MIKIISLSGLDGSGKSTQAKKIIEGLEQRGQKVYYFHATNFSLPQRLKALIRSNKKSPETQEHSKASAGKIGILIRKIILPIDLLRFEMLCAKLKRRGYGAVVSDRYFYDTLVNIAFLSKSSSLISAPIRKPNTAFYIKADPDAIMQRARRPDQGINYLRRKAKLYDLLAKEKQLITINGNEDITKVSSAIRGHM